MEEGSSGKPQDNLCKTVLEHLLSFQFQHQRPRQE